MRGPGRSRPRARAALALALVPAALAGCGAARQDASEPSGRYAIEVRSVSFPARQVIARPTVLRIVVHNSGARTAPSIGVTVDSFSYRSAYPELAARNRPIWVIERGPGKGANPPVETQEVSTPGSGQTAYVSTWSLGPLRGGATQAYTWVVTPVRSGVWTVHYTVAPGLAGKAKVRAAAGGGGTRGRLVAAIAPAPPKTFVNPNTGRVEEGAAPPTP